MEQRFIRHDIAKVNLFIPTASNYHTSIDAANKHFGWHEHVLKAE